MTCWNLCDSGDWSSTGRAARPAELSSFFRFTTSSCALLLLAALPRCSLSHG